MLRNNQSTSGKATATASLKRVKEHRAGAVQGYLSPGFSRGDVDIHSVYGFLSIAVMRCWREEQLNN